MGNKNTDFNSELIRLIKSFETSPVLFIGAGFSRRYLGTPSWEELIKHFAKLTFNQDEKISFVHYHTKAKAIKVDGEDDNLLPVMASLIQMDYNRKWTSDIDFRKANPLVVADNGDPFHVAVADYIKSFGIHSSNNNELNLFKSICKNSIAAIITTNYDNLLVDISQFKKYIGQSELLSSNPLSLGEIYMIHGNVEVPNSIIITKDDYDRFNSKSEYLSAKLMTLFIEHPVFFIGYSLNDSNIINILDKLVGCFDEYNMDKLYKFQERLVFINYKPDVVPFFSDFTISLSNRILDITKINVPDYETLFNGFSYFQHKISVNLLRVLKESFASFIISNNPNSKIQVMDIDNERLKGDELAIYIGSKQQINSIKGLVGESPNMLFRDVILQDSCYSAKEILINFIPYKVQRRRRLPIFKYIAELDEKYKIHPKIKLVNKYEDLLNKTIISNHKRKPELRTIAEIKNQEKVSLAVQHILNIPEKKMQKDELFKFLKDFFINYPNFFQEKSKSKVANPTLIRKLVLIYDYLEYKEKALTNIIHK